MPESYSFPGKREMKITEKHLTKFHINTPYTQDGEETNYLIFKQICSWLNGNTMLFNGSIAT